MLATLLYLNVDIEQERERERVKRHIKLMHTLMYSFIMTMTLTNWCDIIEREKNLSKIFVESRASYT